MNNDSELMNWASKLVTIMILTGGKPGSNHNGENFDDQFINSEQFLSFESSKSSQKNL